MDGIKLSFRIGHGYGKEINTRPKPPRESLMELMHVCQEKYQVDLKDIVNDVPQARQRGRCRAAPEMFFLEKPGAVRRYRRRRG